MALFIAREKRNQSRRDHPALFFGTAPDLKGTRLTPDDRMEKSARSTMPAPVGGLADLSAVANDATIDRLKDGTSGTSAVVDHS